MTSWLQIVEEVRIEKLVDTDFQPVAELLDRRNAGVVRSAVYNVADSGLRDAGGDAHFVDGDVALRAKLVQPLYDRL